MYNHRMDDMTELNVEISKSKQKFRVTFYDGSTGWLPLTQENVAKVTRRYTQNVLADHLMNLERSVYKVVDKMVDRMVVAAMGFEYDSFTRGALRVNNNCSSTILPAIRGRANQEVQRFLDETDWSISEDLRQKVDKALQKEVRERLHYNLRDGIRDRIAEYSDCVIVQLCEDSMMSPEEKAERRAREDEEKARQVYEELKRRFETDDKEKVIRRKCDHLVC